MIAWCEFAWLGEDGLEPGVVVEVEGGQIAHVHTGVATPPSGALELRGATLPGMANAHSHAFHRALRGRTQEADRGSFWSWRERMYAVAGALTPSNYHALARAVFAEMVLAGMTVVGEFHYVHHLPDGALYPEPNAMGEAVFAAAREAGIRITLLDTCYLHGGLGDDGYEPLSEAQRRFGDGSVEAWAARLNLHSAGAPTARLGAAIHSVRAVDPDAMKVVAAVASEGGMPLHVHLSEQSAENDACRRAHGTTPTGLLASAGALGPATTAVHATHLDTQDVAALAGSGTAVCFCPTTERDLADGVGPSHALAAAGVPLSVGSDSHAVLDLFEEARAIELDQRLHTGRRGHHRPAQLLRAATANGYEALGWPGGGVLEADAPADLVTVSLDSPWLAGVPLTAAGIVFTATAADVRHVVVGGEVVVEGGRHVALDVAGELAAAITAVTG